MGLLLKRLQLGAKLWLAPGFTLVLLMALASGGFAAMRSQQATLNAWVHMRNPNLLAAIELEQQIKAIHAGTYQLLAWSTASYSQEQRAQLTHALAGALPRARAAAKDLVQRPGLSAAELAVAQGLVSSVEQFTRMIPQVLDMADVDQSVATTMMIKAELPFGTLRADMQALRAAQAASISQSSGDASAFFHAVSAWGAGALVVVTLVSGWVTWAVRRSILTSVQSISQVATRLREGKLTLLAQVDGCDEVATTARAMSDTVLSLRGTIGAIHTAVDEMDAAISEIAAGNHDLSDRTERQSIQLQQTSADMSQLATAVQTNASSTRTAAELSTQSRNRSERSGQMMNQVVEVMQSITASSSKVHDIIGVINAIAFQTNILALNAAVEAARAGEHGKGFAVVAAEVRTLSRRSAQAADEISKLITESTEQVAAGGVLVADTGAAMHQLVTVATQLSALIDGISHANAEQAQGVKGISVMLSDLDASTQQNAALVEQAAAAAASMREESARLVDAVSLFKI